MREVPLLLLIVQYTGESVHKYIYYSLRSNFPSASPFLYKGALEARAAKPPEAGPELTCKKPRSDRDGTGTKIMPGGVPCLAIPELSKILFWDCV